MALIYVWAQIKINYMQIQALIISLITSPRSLPGLTHLLITVWALTITHQHINMSYSCKSKIMYADITVANMPQVFLEANFKNWPN